MRYFNDYEGLKAWWSDARECGQVVQSDVKRIAVYDNTDGDVVIRQGPPEGSDEDVFIIIGINNVEAVITAMRVAADAIRAAQPVAPSIAREKSAKPMTAAERQRKRRATNCHG